MTIDPTAPPPYVPAPPPYIPETAGFGSVAPPESPAAGGRRRRTDPRRPTAWFVAAIITFMQGGLLLLAGLGAALSAFLISKDDGTNYPWVDADGNRYADEYSTYGEDGGMVEVTYDASSDIPWGAISAALLITLVVFALLVVFAVMLVRGRRWAAWALAAVQALSLVALVGLLVQAAAQRDEFDTPASIFVGQASSAVVPVAVLVCLVVGFLQLRRPDPELS